MNNMDIEDEIQKIIEDYGYEKRNGRIYFKSPAIQKICRLLSLKWTDLTRTGKAVLKGDMTDQYSSIHHSYKVNIDKEYYLKIGKK